MSHRIGFVVNPIAGMGGRVGLKGTDGVVELARARGAVPRAGARAVEMLHALRRHLAGSEVAKSVAWLTCAGEMGADPLREAGFAEFEIVFVPSAPAREDDTRRAVRAFVDRGATIVLFCGGDGTARDVCAETPRQMPVLGIPAGVKMYSGVFGISAGRTAEILAGFLEGRFGVADAEVLDIDEESFRAGRLEVSLYDLAVTPHEPALVQCAKQVLAESSEEPAKAAIAEHLAESMDREPEALYLLGPGSTVASIGERIGIEKSLLGIDAVRGGVIVGRDVAERELLELVKVGSDVRLVVSPIGAQGFVLGRGNQQLSPEVIRRVGPGNIIIVGTPTKLRYTRVLRFDTGDAELDAELARDGFLPVVTGYHVRRLVAVEI